MKLKSIVKNILPKITSFITIIALVLLMSPFIANAAGLTAVSDTMTREAISTNSFHKIVFTSTSAISAGGSIVLTFPSGFTTTGLVITDLQICHGTGGTEHGTAIITGGTACGATDETLAASPGSSTIWGAVISGTTTITLSAPTGTFTNTITAGQKVTVSIAAAHMVNPSSVSQPVITITTTSDTGNVAVSIVDSDQVSVTATVNSAITFDLDTYNTSVTSTTTNAPYSVNLGVLTTAGASGTTEGGGATPNGIWFSLATNASGGATVSVLSANGSLKSVSTPADTIPSASAAMTTGAANYGICANRNATTTGTLTKVAPFASTCTTTPSSNTVGAVTTTPQTIYNTAGAPVSGGRGEIMVDAENSSSTIAHPDYSDTLTFIATGTF